MRDLTQTGVYKISFPNDKFYIGSTTASFYGRWASHRSELRREIHDNKIMQNHFNKYGMPDFEVIKVAAPSNCIKAEQKYIDVLNPYINICRVAGSNLGRKLSEEVKKRLSIINTGKTHTEETKQIISKQLTGHKRSTATKKKMSEVKSGAKNGMAKLNKKTVLEIRERLSKGEGVTFLGREYGLSHSNISMIKSRKRWNHI